MTLTNCKRCGALIPRVPTGLCSDCVRVEQEEYRLVRDYVRDYPEATVMEVSRETGVSVARIYELVRQGKLVAHSPDSDMAVECVVCGRRIVTGQVCDQCRREIRAKSVPVSDERLKGRLHLDSRLRRPREKGY